MRWVLRCLGLLLLAALAVMPLAAQDGRLPLPAEPSLHERAASSGRIPVIVQLEQPYTRETLLSTPDGKAQRAMLTQTRRALLATWKGKGIKLRSGSDDWMVPYMALWVNARGLRVLEKTRGIVRIIEDVPSSPSLTGIPDLVDAHEAYDMGYTGLDQTVAVLDTGVNADHPLLASRIIGEVCVSSHFPSFGLRSLCPNGQHTQTGTGAASSAKCAGIPACDHGSFTSGIVAGAPFTLGSETYTGIGYGAKILAVQVFTRSTRPEDCQSQPTPCIVAFTGDQIEALQRVYDMRGQYNLAAVLLGFNGGILPTQDECIQPGNPLNRYDIINAFYDSGIATIVPAGNHGNPSAVAAPACIPQAIAVGSTNDARELSAFSNAAPGLLDLLAVGENVQSAAGAMDIVEENGTSAAAAQVAGAWAILRQVQPGASVEMVLRALQDTGIPVTDTRAVGSPQYPFIQIGEAVKYIQLTPAPLNLVQNPGFETGAPPTGWKLRGSGATHVCGAPDPRILSGNCAVRLTSNGAAATVKQTLTLAAADGDFVWFGVHVSPKNASGTIKAKLVGDGGHKRTLKLKVTGKGTYRLLSMSGALRAETYAVTLTFKIAASGGGSYAVDEVMLYRQAANMPPR